MLKSINQTYISLIMAALLPFFLFANVASAACYFDGPSGRLSNYCAVQLINGQRVDNRSLRLIDYKLKMEGNTNGLGLPSKVNMNTTQRYLSPLLFYSNNINGGNSSKPLNLPNLPNASAMCVKGHCSKAGMLAGVSAGLSGRHIYGEGRYLQYSAGGSYAYNSVHKLGIGTASARACGVRHILNWWYLDICASQSRVHKDMTDTTNSNLSFIASNILRNSKRSFTQVDFGLKRYFAENYTQNKIMLGFDTIHSNGIFTDFSAEFGELIDSQLVARLSLTGRIIAPVDGKPLSLYANYTEFDGGIMLGTNRNEKSYGISVSYPIWQKISLRVGYQITDSTIDHFDLRIPTLELQLPAIQF